MTNTSCADSSESESWYTIDERLVGPESIFDELSGTYKTKDSGLVRLHTNFPQYVDPPSVEL